jgi:hypothetical protein
VLIALKCYAIVINLGSTEVPRQVADLESGSKQSSETEATRLRYRVMRELIEYRL